uniref:mitochondrial antiviral-signaling protein isoform X1 n=1 Tax=Jaculus jaculus TaxID=51337 RepID=UPI001E1B4673|nr:mitochondrial antiviral-signaling protein isoform X1 [Jaculus jaculus]
MTFAEEKTYKYIYRNHSRFCRVNVMEILPLLPCLTQSDQDRLRASYAQQGNQDTLWELFNRLQRRTGWVVLFIRALRTCEFLDLADEVAGVYQSYLPPVPQEMPTVPAKVSGTSASALCHRIPHNGYQEMQSYPMPVQDTQPPKSPGESLEQVPQTFSSGAVLRMSGGSLEPSPNLTAPSPLASGGHHEQDSILGSMHPRGAASSLTSPCGPLSPTVSFQPLSRPTSRARHSPGPTMSALPPETSFSSTTGLTFGKGTYDQAKGAIGPRDAVVPTSSVTTSSVPSPTNLIPVNTMSSKVPASPELVSTMPPKLSTISKPPESVLSNVLTHPAPSKSPTNLTYADTVPSKVPTSMVSSVNSVPFRSSSKAKEKQEAPATAVTIGGSLPGPDSSSRNLHSEPELSKPGMLLSREDSQLFSGCSDDLAISPSNSLCSEPRHGPEENEYVSIRVQVDESSSTDLMIGNPGLPATQQPAEEETFTGGLVFWAQWFGAASSLLAVLLAVMLYRRRLAQ